MTFVSQYFKVHPVNPQRRLLQRAVEIVRDDGIIVYPTDSSYAFGWHIGDKAALEKIRWIRQTERDHDFTLACRDLSDIATYARVDNWEYRLLRAHTPGPYTFILRATHETPKRLQDPKRRSIGIRVPDHAIAQCSARGARRAADELDAAAARRPAAADRARRASASGSRNSSTRSSTAAPAASSRRPWSISAAAKWPCCGEAKETSPRSKPEPRCADVSTYNAAMLGIDVQELIRDRFDRRPFPVLFAITLHEVAHGWVAKQLGDPTAYMLGRLSLNPLKHVDPIGTVLVPIAMLAVRSAGGPVFGWAKPVPGGTRRTCAIRKRDMAIVALAGPVSNVLMAVVLGAARAALVVGDVRLSGAGQRVGRRDVRVRHVYQCRTGGC